MAREGRIVAVLGPTNTGKTHYAIERMLGYRTGVIGLPLRLLAREVYDRIVAARGPSVVALITGEERIVPPRTQYWVCTVEAMPEGIGADFVAVDEIQLCADPERGHVFTDRLMRMRGQHETLFMGSDTMRGPIRALVPRVEFHARDRMSELAHTGQRKISRMRPRSAIVAFSVESVYAIAELIRRQKGGAAVVMGALSPRTRNAQVALYQNGDVDYLVATDAIGMGLNLDIDHVAFAGLSKFDGRRMRNLAPNELAQIAGRAGRGMSNGSFGTTGEAPPIPDEVAESIMGHRFAPVARLQWRNPRLEFGSTEGLIASLEEGPPAPILARGREADDLRALRALSAEPEVRARASEARAVRLLWDVCRIPDFRGISHGEHADLLEAIFAHIHDRGRVPEDWIARQIARIDRTEGDIDTLSRRLAFIRTWTYVAQRPGWVEQESHWRDATRAVEDRLSDALHARLTQRFVDRRTSVLMRRLKQKEALLAEVSENGEVRVEGEFVGRLEGFRFRRDTAAAGQEARTITSAAMQALAPHFHLRADRFYNAPDTEIDFTEQGGLMWGEQAVGKLVASDDPMKPRIEVFVDEEAGVEVAEKVRRRLGHFMDRKVAALFEPLIAMQRDEALQGRAKGFAFRLVEGFGILPRGGEVAEEVRALDQDARGALRKHGVRFGQFTVFLPALLKPAPTRLRLVLWSLAQGLDTFPEAPPPGLVTIPADRSAPRGYPAMAGYRAAGTRAIGMHMLERLAYLLRAEDTRGGLEARPGMLALTGMSLEQFADLMQGLGYRAERGERAKAKPAPVAPEEETPATEAAPAPDATAPDAVPASLGQTPEVAPAAPQPPEGEAGADGQQLQDTPRDPAEDAAADRSATEPAAPEAVAPVTEAAPAADDVPPDAAAVGHGDSPAVVPSAPQPPSDAPAGVGPEVQTTPVPDQEETEVFFTFTWVGRPRTQARGKPQRDAAGGRAGEESGKPRGKGRPKGGKPKGGKPPREAKPKTFTAGPDRKGKDRIDPDNPFAAALMGLKGKE